VPLWWIILSFQKKKKKSCRHIIYLIDSYFSHAMKICTFQGSPKVHFFFLLKSLLRDFFCARIVKLTNSLVKPSPKNSGFLSKLQHQKETISYISELIVTWINSLLLCWYSYILSFMVQIKILSCPLWYK